MTNRYAPRASALLLFTILIVTLTPAYAMRPFTYHYAFITMTVTDHKTTDPTRATLYDHTFTIQELIALVKN